MNNSRRKRINASLSKLENARTLLQEAYDKEKEAIAKLSDDEEDDDRRDAMEEIVSGLEDVISSLDEAIETLTGADF